MDLKPHEFWQALDAPGTHETGPGARYDNAFPATLPDGRQLRLPIRDLPGGGAVASLIVNQAAFAVEDALADIMAAQWSDMDINVVLGVPTLGLPLANAVARRLGHRRMVPLGTSRKFWYTDALSEPMSSITSPQRGKVLYLDPRMVPLLTGKRILVVDDVVSTGASMAAVLRLLGKADIAPFGIAVAMEQGSKWRDALPRPDLVRGAIQSPLLQKVGAAYAVMSAT